MRSPLFFARGCGMGFLSGRVTFTRLQVSGSAPDLFGPKELERLEKSAAGRSKITAADGVDTGWTAGDHVLDTRFSLEKNIINEALLFCLRVDTQKIPAELKRAYYQIELEGMKAANAGSQPNARQKREARDASRERLEGEAKDGRFVKRKLVPVLWDARSNELLAGTTSVTALEQLHGLFERTFGRTFDTITAGKRAYDLAELRGQMRAIDDAAPSPFVPGNTPNEIAWIADADSRDFLGNEFLLWLWYVLEAESDTLKLSDKSEGTVMLARTLVLECPRGQTGHETIRSEGPTRLPEALRAVQAGKWPRKVGMIMVRHDAQYDLTMQAETLAVTGAKMPPSDDEAERARLEGRIDQIRQLIETIDLLYDAFGRRRCSNEWAKELVKIQRWLAKESKG